MAIARRAREDEDLMIKSGNKNHDDSCALAESFRQSAVRSWCFAGDRQDRKKFIDIAARGRS
jgi:hypothetical protein